MTRRLPALFLFLALARPALGAPLDDALKELTARFKVMADAYGLTAEVYTRCDKNEKAAREIRASLISAGEELQRETGLKTSLKNVAEQGFAAGRKRGAELACNDKPGEFATEMRTMTRNGVNNTIAKINDLKAQQSQQPPPAKPR
jgi:hypothetical protein